jgi:hypothetical protein
MSERRKEAEGVPGEGTWSGEHRGGFQGQALNDRNTRREARPHCARGSFSELPASFINEWCWPITMGRLTFPCLLLRNPSTWHVLLL